MNGMRKTVYVVFYSIDSHIEILAREIIKGIERSGETQLQNAKIKNKPNETTTSDISIIEPFQLIEADGIIFGIQVKCGMLPFQMKAFFDSCGKLWTKGALVNKFVGTFFSTENIGNGESAALSIIPYFAHMGMIYVTMGAKTSVINDISQVHGGSNYGCGTINGFDGKRKPTKTELDMAEAQGFDFGSIVRRQGSPITSISF